MCGSKVVPFVLMRGFDWFADIAKSDCFGWRMVLVQNCTQNILSIFKMYIGLKSLEQMPVLAILRNVDNIC